VELQVEPQAARPVGAAGGAGAVRQTRATAASTRVSGRRRRRLSVAQKRGQLLFGAGRHLRGALRSRRVACPFLLLPFSPYFVTNRARSSARCRSRAICEMFPLHFFIEQRDEVLLLSSDGRSFASLRAVVMPSFA